MESEEEVPEDECNGDNTSPQLLPNVEHLGIVILCYLWNIINFCLEMLFQM